MGAIKTTGDILREFLESYMDDEDLTDDTEISPADRVFGDTLKTFLQTLLDGENAEDLEERFTDNAKAKQHFLKHCLGTGDKKSTKRTVLYDFKTFEEYKKYEDQLATEIDARKHSSEFTIASFYDHGDILKKFKNFFAGDCYVTFLQSCGLCNTRGAPVDLTLHNSCSAYTTNFRGPTVDYRVSNYTNRTITLFPVSAERLERAINNAIKNYSKEPIEIKLKED